MTSSALEPIHFPFFDYKASSFSLGLETPSGIWLSGHTSSRFSPEHNNMIVAGEGDIVAQARVSHDKIAAILQAAGLGLESVVRLVAYVTVEGMADYPRLAELRRELFGDAPPVISTVVVQQLLRPTAYIEIEAVASRGDSHIVSTAGPSPQAIVGRRMGDVIYISAQLPLKPRTNEVAAPGDLMAQTRQIYDNTTTLLAQAGLGWEHVVKTVNITPDAETGIGSWSDADFINAMTQGIGPDGKHYFPVFPYTSFTRMTQGICWI